MGKKRVNASLGFFLSSFLLYVRRLETNQSEDTDVQLVSKILCGLEGR